MFNQNQLENVSNDFENINLNRGEHLEDPAIANEALHKEKSALRVTLSNWGGFEPEGVHRVKNEKDSTIYRKYGNDYYKFFKDNTKNTEKPDDRTHEKIWRFYTQSIALAPNGSSNLALGYGNRSALLFHLEKYEDCIKDCNRAIEITSSEFLKCKLMCRKADCLAALNKNSAQSVCKDALKKLSELAIDENLKSKFVDKLHNILNTFHISNTSNQNQNTNILSELVDLKYQKEAPCASESIKINYNEKYGRHITATKNINPGDIVAIENNFCKLLLKPGLYLFCSNCGEPAWSSIPCRYCIHDVYCSEKCMLEAWKIFHEYECPVFPYIWDIDQNFTISQKAIRVALIMIHKAGGIEQLKRTATTVEDCNDPRTKGFSSDGVFYSDQPSSMYSHMYGNGNEIVYSKIYDASTNVYLLATKTELFGERLDFEPLDRVVMDDILFVGALIARIDTVLYKHYTLLIHDLGPERICYAMSMSAFNSLFNHSCHPNTELISVSNNRTLIYAKHPIEKGEQLFVSYNGEEFLTAKKEKRQKFFKKLYDFNCDCLACKEDWSDICIPSSSDIFDATPALKKELGPIFDTLVESSTPDGFKFSLESAKMIKSFLKKVSKKMTVHCRDYYSYEMDLVRMFIKHFGHWSFNMTHKCIDG